MPLVLRAVLLILLALIPAALVQLHLDREARRARLEQVHGEALRIARLVAGEQQRIFEGARHVLTAMAASEVVRSARPGPECDAYMAGITQAFPRYTAAWTVDPNGRAICAPSEGFRVQDVSDRAFFREAMRTGGFALGELVEGRTTGRQTLHAALPVHDAQGQVAAVAVLGLSAEWLGAQLAAVPLPPGANLLAVDRAGVVVARAPDPGGFVGRPVPNLQPDMLRAAEPGTREMVSIDGSRRVVGFVPLSEDPPSLYVGVAEDATAALAGATGGLRGTAMLILGSIGTAIVLLLLAFRGAVSRPVEQLLAAARRWREGDYGARIGPVPQGGEFARLASAFDAMAEELEARERPRAESERRIRALMEVSPQIVLVADADGFLTWVNGHFTDTTGLPRDAALGDGWLSALHEGDRDRVRQAWLEATRGGVPLFECDARLRAGEAWRWHLCRAAPLRDATGSTAAWVGVAADVHDLKTAQAVAAEGAARLAATYANAPVGLALLDARLRFIAANEAMARLSGHSVAEHLGRPLAEAAPALSEKAGELFRGILASGQPVLDLELAVSGSTGEEQTWLCNFHPVRGADGRATGISLSVFDITARKRAERTERLLLREVDHRAKNVLAVVRSLVRLSAAECPDDVDTLVTVLEGRIAAMTRAHTLLARSRWTGADLAELAREELALHPAAEIAGPAVRITAEAAQPLAMLLHELCTNAAKYGALSDPAGWLRVSWSATAEGGLRLEWQEGGGPEIEGEPEILGFGSRLIDANAAGLPDGEIERFWERGGLRVVVTAGPDALAAPMAPAAPGAGALETGDGLDPAGSRVLVVEDEVLVALETARMLDAMGCKVIGPAFTVEDGLALLGRTEGVDAAVLDVNLRGLSIAPVADALRRRGVPTVVVSGYGAPPEGHEHLPVVDKPATQATLRRAIGRALAARAAVPAL